VYYFPDKQTAKKSDEIKHKRENPNLRVVILDSMKGKSISITMCESKDSESTS